MTQFKIGDSVIMTADSGKGNVFNTKTGRLLNGEYEAIIVEFNKGYPKKHDTVWVILLKGIHEPDTWYFNSDGSCSTHPGMSIRPAEVDEYEVIGNIFENPELKDLIIQKVEPTPSQWIEGELSEDIGFEQNLYLQYNDDTFDFILSGRTVPYKQGREIARYCVIQLPPPPPAKEVEAFGILEYINKYTIEGESVEAARSFYSQLATAENLNKYIKQDANFLEENKEITLDSWIIRCSNSYSHGLLFFTPAALDELGVK